MRVLAVTVRVERAWLDAYHAADADPLSAAPLGSFPPEQLADLVFVVHPATRVVRSRFSVVTIFAANRGEAPVDRIDASVPEDALITPPDLYVVVRHLPPGAAVFLTRLMAARSRGEAPALARVDAPRFGYPS